MGDNSKKRVTVKPKHPNPLFEQWLTEWRDKAKESDSKMQYCFSTALSTLRKYPLPLESGRDCKILKGFGEKLCKMLDDKLKKHKAENGNVAVVTPAEVKKAPSPRKSTCKEYIPQYRSGAFAILVTLFEKSCEPGYQGFMSKSGIIERGQGLCDVSFTKPGPDTRYTGWSSMKTLLEKNLVTKQGNPPKFSLTKDGETLADKLYIQHKVQEFQKEAENLNDIEIAPVASCSNVNHTIPGSSQTVWKKNEIRPQISTTSTTSQSSTSTAHETVIIAANSFQIILLVDTQELNGSRNDADNDPIIRDLKQLNVCHEVRNLKVGDYLWICRDSSGNELVLPYIIERKRMDDLGHSIKDGRFHEQKFRLKQCGVQNLIYLIENFGKNEHVGLPVNTLYQAAMNTLVHDGFTVKFTDSGRGSCEYLACLCDLLKKLYKEKTLVSCPKEDIPPLNLDDDLIHLMHFKEFNKSSAKSRQFKVKEMFVRQLLQIKGMSVEKALAITDKYPTPMLLKLTYNEMGPIQGEKLLAGIQYGTLKKNVGAVLSKTVYQLFCNDSY